VDDQHNLVREWMFNLIAASLSGADMVDPTYLKSIAGVTLPQHVGLFSL